MPLHTTDALILRTYKLGEVDRIVVFLTRDRGKKRGVAQGARRVRSRFMGALEPMTRAVGGGGGADDARRCRLLRARAARSRQDQLRRTDPFAIIRAEQRRTWI